uniref:Uncharacterized protein n=1 Tax=Anguilla anguilla TaxID=7936 RepID=A0A0E9VHQ9_ANGAN
MIPPSYRVGYIINKD